MRSYYNQKLFIPSNKLSSVIIVAFIQLHTSILTSVRTLAAALMLCVSVCLLQPSVHNQVC